LQPGKLEQLLDTLTDEEADALLHDWSFWARDAQLIPARPFDVWLVCAGRGFGKTRVGAETVREWIKQGYGRIAMIAPTAADARDVMIEGESGLLSVCWKGDHTYKGDFLGRPIYEPSKRRITWENGAICTTYSAEEPERLRGPQHEKAWGDEVAAWTSMQEVHDMLTFGLRLGDNPQCIYTTTPKPKKFIRELIGDSATVTTTGSSYDNQANLSPKFIRQLQKKYEGTELGNQEIHAKILDEAKGALWKRKSFNYVTLSEIQDIVRIVVSIDPAVTKNEQSDETGLVVTGRLGNGRGVVLEDLSGYYTPDEWANRAVSAFHRWKADRIVAEVNNGGDMVEHTIRTVDANVAYKKVHASKGKQTRAEPVAALYEQKRIDHVRGLVDLEDQLCTWEPLGDEKSPDRLDATVWGFTELFIGEIAEPTIRSL